MAEPSYELYRPTDHPVPERPVRRAPRGGCCGSGWVAPGTWVKVSAICVGIWLLTGGPFWPMWVMLGLGFALVKGRR